MERQGQLASPAGDRRALPVVVLGLLVGIVPSLAVRPPDGGGPVVVGVYVLWVVAALVGLATVAAGLHSYRTENLRPAMTAATTVTGLILVIAIGALVETSGGPLIPLWAWLVAGALAVGVALAVTERFVGE
ncbi:hypothetical protein [Halococcus agarilyticus]|uniref:hypothetical protein n=1 Tax=Halococcus agarilyticus TaxID=1232219 RepID=UPI0006776E0F|nr:hypothetical protein [Halococcus agarilyticus]